MRPRRRAANRRATVLIMVVAMLAALFIVGAAFLSAVTFESSSIARVQSIRQRSSVIDGLSREVRDALRRGFLGSDGKAWNGELLSFIDTNGDQIPDTRVASLIGADRFGEVAGVNPLIASIEPYQNIDTNYYWHQSSDLELTLNDQARVGAIDKSGVKRDALNLVHVDFAIGTDNKLPVFAAAPAIFASGLDNWNEQIEGQTVLVVPTPAKPNDPPMQLYRRDADGDGVWDSYEYRLPMDRFPLSKRGDLPQQLRQPDFDVGQVNSALGLNLDPDDPNFAEDTMFYALRVVPHGAMVDVAHAHRTMLEEILGSADAQNVAGPYVTEGEELWLRRRFLLPSREPVLSALQLPTTAGQLPAALYSAFAQSDDALDNRWWPIDTGLDGAAVGDINNVWIPWVDFDPNDIAAYGYRQILTTASHDDQLMRLGRSIADKDWIDDVLANPGNYSIDEWPDKSSGVQPSPLTGRLKVSLPGVVEKALERASTPPPGGTAIDIDSLLTSQNAQDVEARDWMIGTIHDAFLLMLRNALNQIAMSGGNKDELNRTAAALTANLIDFVDSDEVPTEVGVRDIETGERVRIQGDYVYMNGLEHQPFITEVYALNSSNPSSDEFAVELYNPFDVPISLSDYHIAVDDRELSSLNGTIQADGFKVIVNSNTVFSRVQDGGRPLIDSMLEFRPTDTKTMLIRNIGSGRGVRKIVVDQMTFANPGVPSFAAQGDTPRWIERDTGYGTSGGIGGQNHNPWLAPVPYEGSFSTPGPSLGQHAGSGSSNAVELFFANTGKMETAFPTTGSLLMLCRYANTRYSPSNFADSVPFTASLGDSMGRLRIDNGRMPVFDNTAKATTATGALDLAVPWGQLVFDYFTALPLGGDPYTPDFDSSVPDKWRPTVDQNGVRVHGRVDLNSAPWKVLAGVPLVPLAAFPPPTPLEPEKGWPDRIRNKVSAAAAPLPLTQLDAIKATPLGAARAKAIVAYREARQVDGSGNYDYKLNPSYRDRAGTGFLTVGELANVRSSGASKVSFRLDAGEISNPPDTADDYIRAIATLVALGDWVTVRSHVFTVYGTLRGVGQKSAVDQRAIRFQETVDRLPSLYNNLLPRRVGPRVVGPYAQANEN